jgi:uncharacterized membrane protein YhfC
MKSLSALLVVFPLLCGGPSLRADDATTNAFLTFACDGTALEQQFLYDQSATWIVDNTRVLQPSMGSVVYRVPVRGAQMERLDLLLNLLPYRLDFSADGVHWETIVAGGGNPAGPLTFTRRSVGFTPAQCQAARSSGYAWIRLQPAGESNSQFLRLQDFQLIVSDTVLPPHFFRQSWWRQIVSAATGPEMILAGALPILIVWLGWHTRWWIWASGAVLWAVSVALKFAFASLSLQPVYRWLNELLPQSCAGPLYWSYVGLLTGVFECGIFLVIARLIRRREWSWRDALALGVGFGGMEAMALGLPVALTATQSWDWAASPLDTLAPAFERLIALFIHVAAVVMILRALIDRSWKWFALSFIFKSAVDSVAGWLLFSGTSLIGFPWRCRLIFAPFAVLGVLVLFYLRRRWRESASISPMPGMTPQHVPQRDSALP